MPCMWRLRPDVVSWIIKTKLRRGLRAHRSWGQTRLCERRIRLFKYLQKRGCGTRFQLHVLNDKLFVKTAENMPLRACNLSSGVAMS